MSQGANSIAIGYSAGQTTQGIRSIAIGDYAGSSSQGHNSIAIGRLATTGIGGNSIAIGTGATTSTFGNSVAIGHGASSAANQITLGTAVEAVMIPGPTTATGLITANGGLTTGSGQVLTSTGTTTLTGATTATGLITANGGLTTAAGTLSMTPSFATIITLSNTISQTFILSIVTNTGDGTCGMILVVFDRGDIFFSSATGNIVIQGVSASGNTNIQVKSSNSASYSIIWNYVTLFKS